MCLGKEVNLLLPRTFSQNENQKLHIYINAP